MRYIGRRAEGAPSFTVMLAVVAVFVLLAAVLIASSAGAQSPGDTAPGDVSSLLGFIKFEDIDGESTDPLHEGWSDLATFDQSLLMPATGDAGRGVTRATFEDILVAKYLDASGPLLQQRVAKGTIVPTVQIELQRWIGEERFTFYRYELTDVQVTSYNVGTTGQSGVTSEGEPRIELGGPTVEQSWPVEEVSLAYQVIKVTYYPANGGPPEFSWDVRRNAAPE